MKAAVVFVVALFAVVSATPVQNKNLITDIIEGIINNNRDKLADLTIEHIDTEHGTIDNLNIKGADKFVIERLDAAGPLSVDIKNATITLTDAQASALWALTGLVVDEIGLNVDGAGDASGSLKDLFATVALDLSLDGLTPVLEDFSDLYINIGSIDATLNGLQDPNANGIINSQLAGYLSANLPRIAEENKPAIIAKINEILGTIV